MVLCQACHQESQFEYDPASGTAYCTFCGSVAEENGIVAEVTFGENSTGAAIVNGAYVGADQTRVKAPGGRRPAGAGGVESREQTIANGRRKIQAMINALKLPDRFADQAQRFYSLALNNNFVRGRRTNYVVSSCLYIVCRMEKTSHMLIDFSDLLQVNVFVLGSTYLKLVKDLNLTIPTIDPSLFISRFASLLEFGDETQQVANDATRLVQRFSRDWMQTGRRPAGICGAAIVLAARMNNFRRSIEEVVQVVKIADGTVKKRLEEFSTTPSSALTITDFRTVDLTETVDPPAYLENKKKEKKQRTILERKEAKKVRFSKSGVLSDDEDEEEEEDEDDDEAENTDGDEEEGTPDQKKQTTQGSMQAINAQMADMSNSGLPDEGEAGDSADVDHQDDEEEALNIPTDEQDEEGNIRNALASIGAAEEAEGRVRGGRQRGSSSSAEPTSQAQAPAPPPPRTAEEIAADEAESAAIANDITSELATQHYTMISSELADKERARWIQAQNPAALRFNDERKRESSLANNHSSNGAAFGHVLTAMANASASGNSNGVANLAGDTLSDLDEDELDAFILTEDEVRVKERLWMEFNKDYLASVAEKHLRAELDEKPLKKRDRKKKAQPRDSSMPQGETAAESTKQLLKQKKFSKKINYAAIDSLLADDGDEKKYTPNGGGGAYDDATAAVAAAAAAAAAGGGGGVNGIAGLTAANLNDFFGDDDDNGDAVSRTSRASSMAPSVVSMAGSEGNASTVSSSRLKKRKREGSSSNSTANGKGGGRRGSSSNVDLDAEKLKRRIQLGASVGQANGGKGSPARSIFTGGVVGGGGSRTQSILQPTRRKTSPFKPSSAAASNGTNANAGIEGSGSSPSSRNGDYIGSEGGGGDPTKAIKRASSVVANAVKRSQSAKAADRHEIGDAGSVIDGDGDGDADHVQQQDGNDAEDEEMEASIAPAPAPTVEMDLNEDEEEEEDEDDDHVIPPTHNNAGADEEDEDDMTAEFRRMRGRSGGDGEDEEGEGGGMDDEWWGWNF